MSYYIDKIIAGVQDYLGTKGLTIDPSSLNNPEFYYMFGEDPANWNLGPHLISTDGSDVMLNPTYLALNSNNWYDPNIGTQSLPESYLTVPEYKPSQIENLTLSPIVNDAQEVVEMDVLESVKRALVMVNFKLIYEKYKDKELSTNKSKTQNSKLEQKTNEEPAQTETDASDEEKTEQSKENHNPDLVELDNSRNDTTDTSETEQKTKEQPAQTETDTSDEEKQNTHSDEKINNSENKTVESDETTNNDDKNSVNTKKTKPALTLQLSNLNNKIKKLNELQQQTVLESEQKQVGEKTSENTEEDLTKKEEITRAVQNFDKGIYDIENGFNLLITDENGNPSPLYYAIENGVYYRLDDETKKPIDTTKSQLKLTENEYKSYLDELNNKKKENETLAETENVSLATDNLATEPLVDTQQTGMAERQVYAPQTQQQNVSPQSKVNQQAPNVNQSQQQTLTPEQQAQRQQQAQQALLQAEQQKKEDEKANFLVKTGRWIQENIFDTVGNAIPIPFLGTGIKMIGNVFTGLLKTIGHIFDGNWKKMASDGWSWLKDTAIVGGTTFGIYKLGKSLDWWGKDKSKKSSSGTNIGDLSDEQVASMAEKVITGKSGVFSSSTKPLTTLVNAQNNIAENNGVSDALRKTASIAAQAESTADIIQQNTKTME